MMMDNGLDFILVYLALVKIAAIPAFINTNLTGDSLLHCVKVVNAKGFVFDCKYAPTISQVKEKLDSELLFISSRPSPDENRVTLPVFIKHQVTQEGIVYFLFIWFRAG